MKDEPKIYIKVHQAGGQVILAACDRELLGKTLQNGDLDFKVSIYFYGADLVNDDTFINIIKKVTCANIVGDHCMALLVDANIIDPAVVMKLGDVDHVQIYDIIMDERG